MKPFSLQFVSLKSNDNSVWPCRALRLVYQFKYLTDYVLSLNLNFGNNVSVYHSLCRTKKMKLIANDLHSLFCNEKTDEIYFAQLKNKVFGSLHESEKPFNGWKHDATIVYVSQLATLSTLTTLMNKST